MSILDKLNKQQLSRQPHDGSYFKDELNPDKFEMAIVFVITLPNSYFVERMIRNVTALMEPFGDVHYFETDRYPTANKDEKGFRHGIFQMDIPRNATTFLKKMSYVLSWISPLTDKGYDFYQSTKYFYPDEDSHFYSLEYTTSGHLSAYDAVRGWVDPLYLTFAVGKLALRFGFANKAEELRGRPYKLFCFFNDREIDRDIDNI